MTLIPFSKPEKCREYAAKHYFSLHECFWELDGRPREDWLNERTVLERADVLRCPALVPGESSAARLLDERYLNYHRLAEQACDQAIESGDVFPHEEKNDRMYYLGRGGLLAIASNDERRALITAFRPGLIRDEQSFEEASGRYLTGRLRSGVRRITPRAS